MVLTIWRVDVRRIADAIHHARARRTIHVRCVTDAVIGRRTVGTIQVTRISDAVVGAGPVWPIDVGSATDSIDSGVPRRTVAIRGTADGNQKTRAHVTSLGGGSGKLPARCHSHWGPNSATAANFEDPQTPAERAVVIPSASASGSIAVVQSRRRLRSFEWCDRPEAAVRYVGKRTFVANCRFALLSL